MNCRNRIGKYFILHVFGEVALVENCGTVRKIAKLGGGYLLQGKTEISDKLKEDGYE